MKYFALLATLICCNNFNIHAVKYFGWTMPAQYDSKKSNQTENMIFDEGNKELVKYQTWTHERKYNKQKSKENEDPKVVHEHETPNKKKTMAIEQTHNAIIVHYIKTIRCKEQKKSTI